MWVRYRANVQYDNLYLRKKYKNTLSKIKEHLDWFNLKWNYRANLKSYIIVIADNYGSTYDFRYLKLSYHDVC